MKTDELSKYQNNVLVVNAVHTANAHGIRYFLRVEKFDMHRGWESRCFQPFIIVCPLTSADLGESPTSVKLAPDTDHDLGVSDTLDAL
jgi:hypothetical protein